MTTKRPSKIAKEPIIDHSCYNSSLTRALSYYNTEHGSADYKQWFLDHFRGKVGFSPSRVPDFEYRKAGVIARLLYNGNTLSEEHDRLLEAERIRLLELSHSKAEKVEGKKAAGPSIQDKMDDRVRDFVGEFNGCIDEFILEGRVPNVTALLNSMRIAGPMCRKVMDKIRPAIAEYELVLGGSDRDLVEGYSNFKKADIKKILSIYETLSQALNQQKVAVPRKARKVKVKPAAVIVQKLKYLKSFPDLNLTSVSPTNIIGSTECWVYNTKTKKLQSYFAADGETLMVKGSSLLNWNPERSRQRTIRKPETLVKITSVGKRALGQFVKALTTKESELTGRVNEDCVIIAAL